MADISKASRIVERDLRFREQDPQVQAERQRIIEALRHGNIHEVFAKEKKFKVGDFANFFSNQWKNFSSQILQEAEIKAGEASYHPPNIEDFPIHHKGASLSPDEGILFGNAMSDFLTTGTAAHAGGGGGRALSGGFGKAQSLDGSEEAATSGEATPMTADEIAGGVEGTLQEWDLFVDDTWGTIFDAQLTQEMQRKMGEIKSEVQRIIALAKEGKIGVEFVLIALAKVNATKNGVLMSGLGKKMYKINQDMNDISAELESMSTSDPNYYSTLQSSQSATRDGTFQQNLLVQDMQKVMQDVASTIESVHGMIGEINRTRRELITHIAAR